MRALMPDDTVKISETVICKKVTDEMVLLKAGICYGLDPVGTWIWELMATSESPKTVQEIRDALMQKYAVELGRCEHDLLALIQELATHGLVEIGNGADS